MFKQLVVAFLSVAVVLPAAGCRKKLDELGIRVELEQHSLPNGLKIVLAPDHTVPVVSYQTWYRVGSMDETPGSTGMAHLFEHLMFKGTPKYGAKQFFFQLEAKGAEVNAYTTRDYTVYYESFTPNLLEKVVDMEADRMTNLTLNEQVLQTERNVVLEERALRTDNSPSGRMQEALWGLAYRVHPYSWPVIGYPDDLMSLNVGKLTEFYKAFYQPANAILVITGDIDPDRTLELIKRHYGPIPGRKQPERKIPAEPEQKEERRLILRDEVAAERFSQAYHITSARDDDSYALDVLASILFEGTSSRAYRRLVEEKELLLGVTGAAYTPGYPGLFLISGSLKGKHRTEEAEAALDQLLNEVKEKSVAPDEIQTAVRQLTVQLVDSVRTPYGLGQLLGAVMMFFGEPDRFYSDLEKYFRVSADDVKRVANKYLFPNNRSIVILVPNKPEPVRKGSK